MTDDATWWIPGKKDRSPSAGLYPKEKIGRLFHRMALHQYVTGRLKAPAQERKPSTPRRAGSRLPASDAS